MRFVLASGNRGKLGEFAALFAGTPFGIVSQQESAVPEADETGQSFVENAIIKARNAATHAGLPAIADDSGLEVDALGGAPGVWSSRFAGVDAGDRANLQKLLRELEGVPEEQRGARFHCVIVCMRHPRDPVPLICQAAWEGRILFEPRGDKGFGYDPVFLVPTHGCSSAELPPEVKNRISHRGQALAQLLRMLPGLRDGGR